MKIVGFCMALWLAGLLFNCFSNGGDSGMMIVDGKLMTTSATSRYLKGARFGAKFDQRSFDGDVSLEDYRPYDPSPSSKASVRPGPIVHGTPLLPYIPNPKPSPPPSFDEHDESKSP